MRMVKDSLILFVLLTSSSRGGRTPSLSPSHPLSPLSRTGKGRTRRTESTTASIDSLRKGGIQVHECMYLREIRHTHLRFFPHSPSSSREPKEYLKKTVVSNIFHILMFHVYVYAFVVLIPCQTDTQSDWYWYSNNTIRINWLYSPVHPCDWGGDLHALVFNVMYVRVGVCGWALEIWTERRRVQAFLDRDWNGRDWIRSNTILTLTDWPSVYLSGEQQDPPSSPYIYVVMTRNSYIEWYPHENDEKKPDNPCETYSFTSTAGYRDRSIQWSN